MTDTQSTPETQPPPEKPSARQKVGAVLTHPLFITLVAAVLGSFLLPGLTRSWADRQSQNTLKQDLVEQISTSTEQALSQAQSLAKGDVGTDYTALKTSWNTSRQVVRPQLVVYFPKMFGCWYSFDNAVSDYTSLAGDTDAGNRKERVAALEAYIGSGFASGYVSPGSGVEPSTPDGCRPLGSIPPVLQQRFAHLVKVGKLANLANPTTDTGFRAAYAIAGEELSIDMSRIVDTIARAHARGFHTGMGL